MIGSSLVVVPAANMPLYAKQHGAKLIILNKGETPYDGIADLRFSDQIRDVLPPIVENVTQLMNTE